MGQMESTFGCFHGGLVCTCQSFSFIPAFLPPLTVTTLLKKQPSFPSLSLWPSQACLIEKNLSVPITLCGHSNAHLSTSSWNEASLLYKTVSFPSVESCSINFFVCFLPSHYWLLHSSQKSSSLSSIKATPVSRVTRSHFYPQSLVFQQEGLYSTFSLLVNPVILCKITKRKKFFQKENMKTEIVSPLRIGIDFFSSLLARFLRIRA